MAATSIFEIATNTTSITGGHGLKAYMALIGSPEVAMLISLLFAIWSMGLHQHRSMADINKIVGDSLKSIVMLLMIICGGAAFKQVLIDGGVGTAIQHMVAHVNISPLILGWVIAVILRIALGSAAVASMPAAGLVTPSCWHPTPTLP